MAGNQRAVSFAPRAGDLIPTGTLLTLQAKRGPERPALTFEGRTWSYGELEANANRKARQLAEMGVGEGDFVTIGLPNGPEFHEVTFAAWKLGAIPAPVSHKLPDIELRAIVELANPKVVVGFEPDRVPGLAALSAGSAPDPRLSGAPLPERLAKYWKATTSGGSTGRPKVIVDHRPAAFAIDAPALGMTVDDVILNPAPLYHNAPFGITHMALGWGSHVVEMSRFSSAGALALIEQHRIKWAYLVPTMMNRIWALPAQEREAFDVSSLEMILHMAAACPVWLKEAWIEWLGPEAVWELYAGTEGMGGTVISGREWLAHKGSVGQIPLGANVKIVGDDGTACPPGEVGEIYFLPPSGKGSTYHYLGSEARSMDDWESYGDMGWVDADNYLYLADRRTDLIISGGSNIYPAEVEAALDAHPTVGSSVVVGLPDDDLGHRVHAIIELRPGAEAPSAGDLLAFAAERLARYKLPHTWDVVTEPLRDDAGKVRRTALRDERAERAKAGEVFAAFRG
ncbi:MAG: acid--CoA ligase [Caulobacter sp.]|nr:acid--CoA ligase [Caulobacter sp.]